MFCLTVSCRKQLTNESHAASQNEDAIQSSDFHKLISFIPMVSMREKNIWTDIEKDKLRLWETMFKLKRRHCKVFIGLPCKSTTSSEQVHKGHTNEAVHIQDQVWFLIQQNQHIEG